jgi:hypothetical protein
MVFVDSGIEVTEVKIACSKRLIEFSATPRVAYSGAKFGLIASPASAALRASFHRWVRSRYRLLT